ncbi:hypothetical protein Corgl_0037 [Coriobacterium glomerans PW2]|uniref:Lipoprotein n=1 Tax=Coriobacterium glomerans (strain ATCC 49209 / DSM 20642 / JCM 10262 / PW2) TaxID=700015 RepID=F2N6W7_CORGP|nr:hypothetical protein [Coriobacterium glomerans]AEB06166.1 hypothetical protein Corgl_0037 [Coriobacterium glomerans PW2]
MNSNAMKRKTVVASLFAIIVICAVLLGGCGGPSDADIIRTKISENLDSVKQLKDDTIDKMIGDGADSIKEYGIDPKEVTRSLFDKFDYKINSIDVNGNKATAHVTLTCKSFKEIMTKFQEKIFAQAMQNHAKTGSDDFNKIMKDALESSVDQADPRDTDCDFNFTKKTDEWSADATQSDELARALGQR